MIMTLLCRVFKLANGCFARTQKFQGGLLPETNEVSVRLLLESHLPLLSSSSLGIVSIRSRSTLDVILFLSLIRYPVASERCSFCAAAKKRITGSVAFYPTIPLHPIVLFDDQSLTDMAGRTVHNKYG
jgi:hypothetical protein